MHTHTYTDRMAMLWSMSPWAGLKRSHILEACRSSLMSNMPHQKTFIPINKAFGKGALHRQAAVPTAHRSVCDCVSAVHGFHLRLCTNRRRGCHHYFFHCWCLHMHFARVTSSSSLHGFDGWSVLLTGGLGVDQKYKVMFMHITDGSKQGK